MSATTEKLLEVIRATEDAIEECKSHGDDSTAIKLTTDLKELKKKLISANETLNESKFVLKG